jgi:quercetin dioxygenase-like cupin family protein
MITKKENAIKRQFNGVKFDVLAIGEKSMVTKMNYNIGDKVSLHSHPNEQSGFVISGQYKINYGSVQEFLTIGDSYSIPENVEHSWEVIDGGEVIDVFTPPRQDYL